MTENESISISISTLSNKEKNQFQEIKWINNNYPIRCPTCYNICLLKNINISNEKIIIKCDNNHENEFNSFNDFLNQVIKFLNEIICKKCKSDNSLDLNNMERCNNCFLVFCKKCISEHKEKEGHTNSIELNKIDTFCYRHNMINKYYNNDSKYHICKECYNEQTNNIFLINNEDYIRTEELFPPINKINNEYEEIKEELEKCKNLINWINEWKDNLLNKINKLNDFLINYYNLKKAIIDHLINNDNYLEYKNNFYVLSNYEMITQFKEIENFLNNASYIIQNGKEDYEKSKMFLAKIKDFPNKLYDINGDKVNNYLLEKNKIIIEKEKEKCRLKLSNMTSKNQYKLKHDIKCFTVINNDKYIILGTDLGDVMIYESSISNGEKIITKRLDIKEFKNPIKFIIEIDNNIIAVSDKISNIKIIELNENLINYSIVQEIQSDKETVYAMIYLPILSYYKNRHHFCMANGDCIFIYKSNKQPKNLLILKENYHDTIQEISIEQPSSIIQENNNIVSKGTKQDNQNNNDSLSFNLIKSNYVNAETYSLIEINEKYIAAACINSENSSYIKLFDVNNNFDLKKDIYSDMICGGSYIMNLVEYREVLVVGCNKGFCLISTKTLDIIKTIDIKMSIISIGVLYDNNMICCAIDEKNSKKIIEFRYMPDSKNIKEGDGSIQLKDEVWDLKCFNNKIYFIFKSSLNIFQK